MKLSDHEKKKTWRNWMKVLLSKEANLASYILWFQIYDLFNGEKANFYQTVKKDDGFQALGIKRGGAKKEGMNR